MWDFELYTPIIFIYYGIMKEKNSIEHISCINDVANDRVRNMLEKIASYRTKHGEFENIGGNKLLGG